MKKSWTATKMGFEAPLGKTTSYLVKRQLGDKRIFYAEQNKLDLHIYNSRGEEIDSGFVTALFPKIGKKTEKDLEE